MIALLVTIKQFLRRMRAQLARTLLIDMSAVPMGTRETLGCPADTAGGRDVGDPKGGGVSAQ